MACRGDKVPHDHSNLMSSGRRGRRQTNGMQRKYRERRKLTLVRSGHHWSDVVGDWRAEEEDWNFSHRPPQSECSMESENKRKISSTYVNGNWMYMEMEILLFIRFSTPFHYVLKKRDARYINTSFKCKFQSIHIYTNIKKIFGSSRTSK